MNGIHDLGGREGFGAVARGPEDLRYAPFHEAWEGRVNALASLLLAAGCWNVDAFRHAIERLDPVRYLTAGYYGRWLLAVESLVREQGLEPGRYENARALREIGRAPRFVAGDAVRTRNHQPPGHTRLPSYARAHRGTVARVHPAWVFPDSHAHGGGERPQHCYAVRFDSAELYGEGAEPGVAVHVDLFEDYLEPA